MENKRYVRAIDTLRTHFTTIEQCYELLDEDTECYKVTDNRGRYNWIPKRYMVVVESLDGAGLPAEQTD